MRRRRLNVKMLLILVGTVVCASGAVFAVHRHHMRENASSLRDLAREARQEGDLYEAAQHLDTYVSLRPDDPEGYVALAETLADYAENEEISGRDYARAVAALETAVLKAPEQHALRRRLIDFYFKFARYKDARDHIELLLEDDPDDGELRAQFARCLLAEGRYEQAANLLAELIGYDRGDRSFDVDQASNPEVLEAYVLFARLLRDEMEDAEGAGLVMDQMVQVNRQSFAAYLKRGQFLRQKEDLASAKSDIARARELAGDDVEVILASAELAMQSEDYQSARRHLSRGIELHPRDHRLYSLFATLELSQHDDHVAALAHLERGLKQRPHFAPLLTMRAHMELLAKDIPAARATIREMEQIDLDPNQVDYWKARVLLTEEKWLEAAREMERLRPLLARNTSRQLRINLFLGRCYEFIGQPDKAMEAYRLALAAEPSLATARVGLQRMMRLTGRAKEETTDDFAAQMQKLLSDPKTKDNIDQMMRTVDRYVASRKLSEAHRLALKAEVYSVSGKNEQAQQMVRTVLAEYPEDMTSWLAAASVAIRDPEQGFDVALKILDKATEELGQKLELRLRRAGLAATQGREKLKQHIPELEADTESLGDYPRRRLLEGLGIIYQQVGLPDDAWRVWKLAAEADPANRRVRLRLFHLAEARADGELMKEVIEDILATSGSKSDSTYQYCQAMYLLSQAAKGGEDSAKLVDRAEELADMVVRSRPEWHRSHQLKAAIAMQRQLYGEAIDHHYQALELGPPGPRPIRQLAQLLTAEGRLSEAQRVLEMLGRQHRHGVLPELQAELFLRSGDVDRSLEMAASAVERDPDNYVKHLWHGQLLRRAGKLEKAEQALRRGVELAPQVTQSWLVLISLLLAADKRPEAVAALQQGAAQVPDKHRQALLSHGYEMLGESEKAEQAYRAALEAEPENLSRIRAIASFYLGRQYTGSDRVGKATAYLNKILSAENTTDKDAANVAWARRSMAKLISTQGTYADLNRALQLIDQNEIDGRLEYDDLLAAAEILARRPEAVSRRQAARYLKQASQRRGLSLRHQLLLAQLYNQLDDWTEARALMLEMLRTHEDDPRVLGTYCAMLLQRGKVQQAERRLPRLEELAPDEPSTLTLKIRLLAAQGQAEKAAQLVLREMPPEPTPADADRILRIAAELEAIGAHDHADRLMQQYVALRPAGAVQLARLQGRRGEIDAAMKTLQRAARVLPKLDLARIALVVIRTRRGEVGSKYDGLIGGWLREAAAAEGTGVMDLLLQQAAFADLRGEHEQQAELYRSVLERSDLQGDHRAMVLNNLAFNLALRDRADEGAMKAIEEAISIRGPTGALLDTRAMVHLALGHTGDAIADLNLAIADRPRATRYFHLALAHLMAGDKQAAHNAYQEAQRRGLDPLKLSALEKDKHSLLLRELGIDPAARSAVTTG